MPRRSASRLKRTPSTSVNRFSSASGIRMRSARMRTPWTVGASAGGAPAPRRPAARTSLRDAQAGPEASPVLDQVVDPPDREDRVHDENPLVDDAVIAPNLALCVFLDLSVSRVALRLGVAHGQPPARWRSIPRRAAPGA